LGFQNSLLLLDQPQKPLPECILIHQTINAAFFEDNESPFRVSVKTGPDHDGLAACFEGRFQTCPMELLTLATEQPTGIRIQTNLDRGLIRRYHTFPFSVLPISVCFTENTTIFPVGVGQEGLLCRPAFLDALFQKQFTGCLLVNSVVYRQCPQGLPPVFSRRSGENVTLTGGQLGGSPIIDPTVFSLVLSGLAKVSIDRCRGWAPQRNGPDSGPQRHLTGSTFPADKPAASQEWKSHSFPHAGLKYSPSHPVFPEAFQTRTPHLLVNACFLSRYHCSAQIRYESCKHRLSGRCALEIVTELNHPHCTVVDKIAPMTPQKIILLKLQWGRKRNYPRKWQRPTSRNSELLFIRIPVSRTPQNLAREWLAMQASFLPNFVLIGYKNPELFAIPYFLLHLETLHLHEMTYSGGQNCPNDTSKNYLAQITTKNYKNN